ncbi:MAG: hypothetical protein UU16_C0035G0035 [Candidatus Woesebacteria bacterium GW2011_GWA2_40_7]|uniref:Uncharacterized protein n=3 Tax=Candidatus Woeseibacteriota TaxID=1752722 RepID=A0A0G0LJZ9_9BACT|nr:MAG: hypothetical protein UT17_C0003G0246 [Candidatus Woesebacteria bacterium GW2011_GWB1_39_10]KKR72954.1 MAG: hypothetical protein UU16_C0035G0035 [Candidatus Woesebacteria bacterium GW2011_GWA2_40_7]KKS91183.1 MAG: hypothetical protein UV66_C0001G0540 [Candidatus Woesebacteria bacterium GW2011_GWA1_43_12]
MEKPIEIDNKEIDAAAELVAKMLELHTTYIKTRRNKKIIKINHGETN